LGSATGLDLLEGLAVRIFVPHGQEVVDRGDEFVDAEERITAETALLRGRPSTEDPSSNSTKRRDEEIQLIACACDALYNLHDFWQRLVEEIRRSPS
jgi:hypothetical protein